MRPLSVDEVFIHIRIENSDHLTMLESLLARRISIIEKNGQNTASQEKNHRTYRVIHNLITKKNGLVGVTFWELEIFQMLIKRTYHSKKLESLQESLDSKVVMNGSSLQKKTGGGRLKKTIPT